MNNTGTFIQGDRKKIIADKMNGNEFSYSAEQRENIKEHTVIRNNYDN